jgi:AcrR family transcriptional regulator
MVGREGAQRRRGAAATRQWILDAARPLFAQDGYTATTVKRVADSAGVSPNLITRYFGGKDGLFLAASNPLIAVDDVYTGELCGLGDRLARSIVRRWSGQAGDDPLLVLLRAAGERPGAAVTLADFLDLNSVAPLLAYLLDCGLDKKAAQERADAIDTMLLGVSMRHRILRSDLPDAESLQAWLSAAIQRLASGG